MIMVLIKIIICGILVHVIVKVIRYVRGYDEYLDLKTRCKMVYLVN